MVELPERCLRVIEAVSLADLIGLSAMISSCGETGEEGS
jgi:hypothetical protein